MKTFQSTIEFNEEEEDEQEENYGEKTENETNNLNNENYTKYSGNSSDFSSYDPANNYLCSEKQNSEKKVDLTIIRNNYQTYRAECSKLMANDEYDPDSIYGKQNNMPVGFDLRNFLREKALRQQLEETMKRHDNNDDERESSSSNNIDDQSKDPEDLDYSQPITKPIQVDKDYFKYRPKIYNNRNNNDYRHKYSSTRDNNDLNNDRVNRYNDQSPDENKNIKDNLNDKNYNVHTESKDDVENADNETDEDEELSYKKLRSVVAKAIINNNNNTTNKGKNEQKEEFLT